MCRYWRLLLRKLWQSTRSLDYTKLSDCVTNSSKGIEADDYNMALRRLRSILERCSPEVLRRFECVGSKATASRDSCSSVLMVQNVSFDDAHLVLLGCFEQLTELDLTRSSVTNRGLCVLASRCRKLQRVTLAECAEVGERGCVSLLKYFFKSNFNFLFN